MINLGFYGPHKRNQKVFSWMTSWRIINLRVVFFDVLFVATTCAWNDDVFRRWNSSAFHALKFRHISWNDEEHQAALASKESGAAAAAYHQLRRIVHPENIHKLKTGRIRQVTIKWQVFKWTTLVFNETSDCWVLLAFAEQYWVFRVFSKHHLTNWFVFMAFALGILEANWRPNSFTKNIILSWFPCHFWLIKEFFSVLLFAFTWKLWDFDRVQQNEDFTIGEFSQFDFIHS